MLFTHITHVPLCCCSHLLLLHSEKQLRSHIDFFMLTFCFLCFCCSELLAPTSFHFLWFLNNQKVGSVLSVPCNCISPQLLLAGSITLFLLETNTLKQRKQQSQPAAAHHCQLLIVFIRETGTVLAYFYQSIMDYFNSQAF